MIHKFGYKDLVHNDNQTNDCPVCKPEQAIARVRELADHFINCSDDCDCERCLEWPTAIIKALDGEQ